MSDEIRPWDIFSKSTEKVTEEMKKLRLDICNSCNFFVKKINVCKQCGCQMNAKASLAYSECPLGKWGTYTYKEKIGEENV